MGENETPGGVARLAAAGVSCVTLGDGAFGRRGALARPTAACGDDAILAAAFNGPSGGCKVSNLRSSASSRACSLARRMAVILV